jgi:hypothetical protein
MRKLGSFTVNEIGLGCMNLSHAYGVPPAAEDARNVLARALDLGVDHFDTAALYGFGRNEELVGPWLKPHRDKITLASKCGMRAVNGKRTIDGRPEVLKKDLEASLKRLGTDTIDLYYLHRFDKSVPIQESVGAMGRFVAEGKVRALGLSEVSATTLQKAHSEHPIAAVQSEYSLWSRNVEIAVSDTCRELGIAFVAFSPLARGFLADIDLDPEKFADRDIRSGMPRFQPPDWGKNRRLLPAFCELAAEAELTCAQLALRWVLEQGSHIHAIPGTTSTQHLAENLAALELPVPSDVLARAGDLLNERTVSGPRYPAGTQVEIDTEEFA